MRAITTPIRLHYFGHFVALACLVAHAWTPAVAQPSIAGARSAALTGDPAASDGDPWAESNPAGWSRMKSHTLGIHAAQLYGLKELRAGNVQLVLRRSPSSAALGVSSFGYEDYREMAVTAGMGFGIRMQTHRPFHFGIRVRYHRISIRNYGSASTFTLSSGFIFPVLAGIELGLSAENISILESPISDELPRRIQLGLAFVGSERLRVYTDLVKDVRSPLETRISAEARPVRVLTLRTGFSLEPPRFAGGFGISFNRLAVDVAIDRHLILGWSPSCSLIFKW